MSAKPRLNIRYATHDDIARGLETFDYTKLTAINMCPTWGITRYGWHKQMPGNGSRAMALEAGKVMHDAFAAIRLASLGLLLPEHAYYHGQRLFGPDRWSIIAEAYSKGIDDHAKLRNAALETLATSDYVNDPMDKYRTFTNLETSLLYYVQRWDGERYPIWVEDTADPTSRVGVEIPFALYVEIEGQEPFLYTGRMDGLHVNPKRDNELLIQENKTAARLNEAWTASFDMSHQVTGYMIAGACYTKQRITRGLVIGLSIPLPRDAGGGLSYVQVTRHDDAFTAWAEWVQHTVALYREHRLSPVDAPKYTHSCNRYFRPCSMIPFCAAERGERQDIFDRQMEHNEWSPLAEATSDSA